jgi:hypothetical protein
VSLLVTRDRCCGDYLAMVDEVLGLAILEPAVHVPNEGASCRGFQAGQPSAGYAACCVLGDKRIQTRLV